ncbi:hypothetical protein P9265_21970 [Schinkia azotoformans]|uniref:hypothetical protein n=1 Tax=Schinkia azotoformans TaxID=1454 RepID=UPI002E1D23DD|nr:hypothetical protein [Schinkia azotoformans]
MACWSTGTYCPIFPEICREDKYWAYAVEYEVFRCGDGSYYEEPVGCDCVISKA